MKKLLMALLGATLFLTGCTGAGVPQLTQMQIREMTTKEMEANYKTTFKAVMTILQDQDYIIDNTDFDSGLIVAEKEANSSGASEVLMKLLVDVRYSKNAKVKVSATILEVTDKVTRVRLNIQEKKVERGTYGVSNEDVVTVRNKEIYETLFNQIRTEIERIKSM